MGVTVIFANGTGVGKSAYLNAVMKLVIRTEGRARLWKCQAKIEELNKKRKKPLTIPKKYPIYANCESEFITGYEETFSPYLIHPCYFGLPNKKKKIMPVVPHAALFFDEMDDEYDSGNRKPLAAEVKGMYNKRRHWDLDIWIVVHRTMAVNVAIRDVADKFIEIQSMESEKDFAGRTIRTKWKLREFDRWRDVERYLQTGDKLFKQTTFENVGDIFKCYDSKDYANEFVPEEDDDFCLLPQRSKVDLKKLSKDYAAYYGTGDMKNIRT